MRASTGPIASSFPSTYLEVLGCPAVAEAAGTLQPTAVGAAAGGGGAVAVVVEERQHGATPLAELTWTVLQVCHNTHTHTERERVQPKEGST